MPIQRVDRPPRREFDALRLVGADPDRFDVLVDELGKGLDESAIPFGFRVGLGRGGVFVLLEETHDVGVADVGHRAVADRPVFGPRAVDEVVDERHRFGALRRIEPNRRVVDQRTGRRVAAGGTYVMGGPGVVFTPRTG